MGSQETMSAEDTRELGNQLYKQGKLTEVRRLHLHDLAPTSRAMPSQLAPLLTSVTR